jgi:hypothetical protein
MGFKISALPVLAVALGATSVAIGLFESAAYMTRALLVFDGAVFFVLGLYWAHRRNREAH